LIVQIDAAGHISGRAKYTLPESKLTSGRTSEAHDCRIEFDLDGRFDPKTGKTTLNLRGGKRFWARKQTDGDIYEWRTEFDTTLNGWRIPGNRDAALANSPFLSNRCKIRRIGISCPAVSQGRMGKPVSGKTVFLA